MEMTCAYCKADDRVPPADNRIAQDTYLCDPCLARWFSNVTERTHMETVIFRDQPSTEAVACSTLSKVRDFILETFDKYAMGIW